MTIEYSPTIRRMRANSKITFRNFNKMGLHLNEYKTISSNNVIKSSIKKINLLGLIMGRS